MRKQGTFHSRSYRRNGVSENSLISAKAKGKKNLLRKVEIYRYLLAPEWDFYRVVVEEFVGERLSEIERCTKQHRDVYPVKLANRR